MKAIWPDFGYAQVESPRAVRSLSYANDKCSGVDNGGKRNMEGKNIYLSVFPKFWELLSFCLLKLTKTIDLQVMRVAIMLRITRLSLWTGSYKKIRITLSTVQSLQVLKKTIKLMFSARTSDRE